MSQTLDVTRPTVVAASPSLPAVSRARDVSEYEHLTPLFHEHARLPVDDPRRSALRNQLIAGYQPVARHIARKHAHRADQLDDLEQVATLGLILAVDRFEPHRGNDFLSFAVPTISGEVLRYFRDRFHVIRVPRRLRQLQASLHQAVAELSQSLGRAPRPSEIAAHLRLDLDTVIEALQAHHAGYVSSLDEPSGDEGSSSERSRFDSSLACTDAEPDLIEYRESLAPLLAALPERERRILLLRFFEGMTQHEIGQQVGISQMHVSRLLAATLATLRRHLTIER
jgi:RNA polymerase sigma-B factor